MLCVKTGNVVCIVGGSNAERRFGSRGVMTTMGGSTTEVLCAFSSGRGRFVYRFTRRRTRTLKGGRVRVRRVRGVMRKTLREIGPTITGDCHSCEGCGLSFVRVVSSMCAGDRTVHCVNSGDGTGASDTLMTAGQDLVFGRLGGRLCHGFFVGHGRLRTYGSNCVCVRSRSTHLSAVGYYLFSITSMLDNKFRVKGM